MDKCDMTRGLGTKVQCIEENFDKRVMVIIKKSGLRKVSSANNY